MILITKIVRVHFDASGIQRHGVYMYNVYMVVIGVLCVHVQCMCVHLYNTCLYIHVRMYNMLALCRLAILIHQALMPLQSTTE